MSKSSVEFYAEFITKQAMKGEINEAELTADHHAKAFEKHAKLYLGHNAASNSRDAEHDQKLADMHDEKMSHHHDKAQHHANEYKKLTGKKLTMPDREYPDDDHPFKNVHKSKNQGSGDQDYLPSHLQTASHKNPKMTFDKK